MSTLNDDDRANIAAYLDGELDEQTAQSLEAKLNQDPEARAEVDALRKAWSMLDFLPRPEPSPNFTNRTMERLTLAVPRRGAKTGKMVPSRPWGWLMPVGWAAVILLGVTVGAVAGMRLWHGEPAAPPGSGDTDLDPVEQLLAHGQPRIAQYFRVYEPLANLEFLSSLNHPDLFGEDAGTDESDRPRKQPELTAKEGRANLRANARVFLALPAERQKQIVKLDKDLFTEVPAEVRDELLAVAQRYRDWLDQLGEANRHRLLHETDKAARLAIVKDLRDEQWLSRQPQAQRERSKTLQGKERADFVTVLREKYREHQRIWHEAAHYWDELNSGKPVRSMMDLKDDVREYVNEYLKPMLKAEEWERLMKLSADEKFPEFPETLVKLADRHPPALRGDFGPKKSDELPKKVRELLSKTTKTKKSLVIKADESWPIYAMAVADLAHKKDKPLPNELWPTSSKCLSPPMRTFLNTKLLAPGVLTPIELRELSKATGKWPDYPEAIQRLARVHKMQPPWFTLPGPRELWDSYRKKE